ncbi:MAG TPA: cytochrome c [Acidimicrobiales bacterium]|jgi:mono/diheme cytochrome c family protein|nr:cytochrome c [Acidimicrobiales bacterium]
MLIAAATTQRAIGWVIFGLVIAGFVIYILVNIRSGKPEVGSEVELAANRKPYLDDAELETKKLDRSLLFALGMLGIIAVGLPLYWLGEPGRHDGAAAGFDYRATQRGAASYESRCAQCHGPGGTGGVVSVALTDADGKFEAQVSWKAPALTSVLTRYDESEVTQVLNYGRNGVMPAWGAPGGGPLTTKQIDDLIHYLRSIQLPEDQVATAVADGVKAGAREILLTPTSSLQKGLNDANALTDPTQKANALKAANAAIDKAVDDYVKSISDPNSPWFATVYGKLLFNNAAGQGAYGCARCHTKGWSYDGATVTSKTTGSKLVDAYIDGGGFFGPNLRGGVTVRKFETVKQHQDFIALGTSDGKLYGVAGMGSGQMPGFGARTDDTLKKTYPAILTENEIAAIVAYERSL